jgi:hypothetical protein
VNSLANIILAPGFTKYHLKQSCAIFGNIEWMADNGNTNIDDEKQHPGAARRSFDRAGGLVLKCAIDPEGK